MSATFLQTIDWSQPWLVTLRERGEAIAQSTDWRTELNRQIGAMGTRNHLGKPIHFVPQSTLPVGIPYEHFISETGGVPTRENLHDFFNALVWLHFPQIKVQLNALQAEELTRNGLDVQSQRGKLRDAATIFDENAVLFVIDDARYSTLLREHAWSTLFVEERAEFWQHCHPLLFGHALMEKLVQPYKAITGHAWLVPLDAMHFGDHAHIDALVARQLASGLSTRDFSPLPILGIPGWWPMQSEAFYADTHVFRAKRSRNTE